MGSVPSCKAGEPRSPEDPSLSQVSQVFQKPCCPAETHSLEIQDRLPGLWLYTVHHGGAACQPLAYRSS